MTDQKCIFNFRYRDECQDLEKTQSNRGPDRIINIIDASKQYGDGLSDTLNEALANNPELIVSYHKNCVSRYTSKTNIPQKRLADDLQSERRKLRKAVEPFNFLTQCLYCGLTCDVKHDPKHPDRWREAYMIRTTETQKNSKGYTQYIRDRCRKLGDKWASEVSCRIVGAVTVLATCMLQMRGIIRTV